MTTSSSATGTGHIVTFYSYKGGTGRSMALATVAWVLAMAGKRVLTVDWDLEAPGLHRYFQPFLTDNQLVETEGLIDFFVNLAVVAAAPESDNSRSEAWYLEHANVLRYTVSLDWEFPGAGFIDFIAAGRQSSAYATRVNSFNWQHFYENQGGGAFVEAFKQHVYADYDYVLIDSRTGVSDTSGICTVQLPDTLVVCFTLNNQSIEGAAAVARSVSQLRRDAGAPEPRILPVPMRIENAEKKKLDRRLEYAERAFSQFVGALPKRARDTYWSQIQFQYVPYYAYEEILAPFGDRPERPTPLLTAVERLTGFITQDNVRRLQRIPEQARLDVLAKYESMDSSADSSNVTRGATAGEPRTWRVGPSLDDDFPSLAQAIDAAEPNERIFVRAGLYDGVNIDKPLEIVGDGRRGEVVIQSTGSYAVRFATPVGRLANLTIQLSGGEGCALEITQGRPRIEDCDINGGSRSGVIVRGFADPIVRNNRIRASAGAGVLIAADGKGTFEDNEIAANAAVGVVIATGAAPVFRSNRVLDNGQSGVFFDKEARGILEETEIAGNQISGVEINAGAEPDVRGNHIHHNRGIGVSIFDGGRGIVERNRIYSNGTAGLAIGATSHITIRANQISNNVGTGVLVLAGGEPLIEDNEITFNKYDGLKVAADASPRVQSNRIFDNDQLVRDLVNPEPDAATRSS